LSALRWAVIRRARRARTRRDALLDVFRVSVGGSGGASTTGDDSKGASVGDATACTVLCSSATLVTSDLENIS
jgi:hypothetical protein